MTEKTTTTDPSAKPAEEDRRSLRPDERVLLLDMWQRSGLTARDFGALVGLSKHTLFSWKKKFDRLGPAVCDLLRALAAAHDAPLVLKVDNGSAFRSHEVRAWAHAVGTLLLYSPPRYPRYNGSIEASIGALATRAHHGAAAAGHPEYWTTDDVERARAHGNLMLRTGGRRSPTAAQRWHDSRRITATERRRFGAHYTAAIAHQHDGATRVQQRTAIVDTLRTLGYVTMKRRANLVHPLMIEKRQTLRA
jgi:transposase InsO family protein